MKRRQDRSTVGIAGVGRSLAWIALAAAGLASQGCVVSPPLEADVLPAPGAVAVDVIDPDYLPFRPAPKNRYALLVRGARYVPSEGAPGAPAPESPIAPLDDPFVDGDVTQLSRLFLSKGYDVYRFDMADVGPDALRAVLEQVAAASDEDTQLAVAYTGEGDAVGLRTRALVLGSQCIIPANATVSPADLFDALAGVRGEKLLLVNACESGVFAEEAARRLEFRGVAITACARGFATTPHEPSGTTAIVAAFLELYADDPRLERNLGAVELDRAGGFWTNFAHSIAHWWAGGWKPLSYEPVVFVRGGYRL